MRPERPELVREQAEPDVDIRELMLALAKVLKRAEMNASHAVEMEPLSVRERMTITDGCAQGHWSLATTARWLA